MSHSHRSPGVLSLTAAALAVAAIATLHGQQPQSGRQETDSDPFRFKSGVELVNVTATVLDASGRFVSGLTRDDFIVYEDDVRQTVTYFNAERVPVSLGVVLDTSGSMAGDKIDAARAALDRFLYDLLDREDEIFLYRFSDDAVLLQGWTTDRGSLSRALGRIAPAGGTAMYDAVAEAIPLAGRGRFQKKAIVIISDGNDTSSRIDVRAVKAHLRSSEVMVYAVGIDSDAIETPFRPPTRTQPPRWPFPGRTPFPGGPRRRPGGLPAAQFPGVPGNGPWSRPAQNDDRVNVSALREMTDDSGGRTEVVRDARDLGPATTSIADELSKQYYLGYTSSNKKDGVWHTIRVELRNGPYRVRARRGYVAN